MELQEAIEHAREVTTRETVCASCREEHGQLADWLEELKSIREILGDCDLDRLAVMMNQCMSMRDEVAERFRLTANIPLDRLQELVQADREGRCAILSEPMKPMIYNPNDTDVYCPACGKTLSGGWPLSDADDYRKLCQCPNCGQSIDDTRCEAALKGEKDG